MRVLCSPSSQYDDSIRRINNPKTTGCSAHRGRHKNDHVLEVKGRRISSHNKTRFLLQTACHIRRKAISRNQARAWLTLSGFLSLLRSLPLFVCLSKFVFLVGDLLFNVGCKMGMVCCVARVHDSVQDDLKYDEGQENISRRPEDNLQTRLQDGKVQEDISRKAETDKGQNDASRQVEDDLQDDEEQNDISRQPEVDLQDDKVQDISRQVETDEVQNDTLRQVEDGLQDDEEQNDISRQPEVDLQDDKVQYISRQVETDEGQNDTLRQVEDGLQDDEEQNDILRQPKVDLQNDEVHEDISRQVADDLQDNEKENDISRQPEDEVPDDIPQQPKDELKDDVKDSIPQKLDDVILSAFATEDDWKDNIDYSSTLINLPMEILVKILLYLPIRDRMGMRHISQRFRDAAEIPLLWKEFTVYSQISQPCLKRYHVGIMANLLKVIGEHVRKVYVSCMQTGKTLQMVRNTNWRNVTHLILYDSDYLRIIQSMPHLQNLKLMLQLYGIYHTVSEDMDYLYAVEDMVRLLEIIEGRIRKLDCYLTDSREEYVVGGIQEFANKGHVLPSIINIFSSFCITATNNTLYSPRVTPKLFKFWSTSAFNLSSFEINLYDTETIIPMNIFPPVPVRKYKFGAAEATPTLIRLSDHGIVNLKDKIFHLSEYIDDHGMISHAVTLDHGDCQSLIEERHLYCTHLHTVSYVDISYQNVNSNHLQQLAVVCPNLQQLYLKGNVNCLKDLQGLHAIVNTCQNLKSLNLAGISVSLAESYLLLWELLSSIKKLTYLAIDLCMILLYDFDDDDEQKLFTMCKGCHSLLALDVHLGEDHREWEYIWCQYSGRESCIECNSVNENFLFSHFPSLAYCAIWDIEYSSVAYAFTDCRHLKYLHNNYRSFILTKTKCHIDDKFQITHL